MKRSMILQRQIRIEVVLLLILFLVMSLAGCGKEVQHAHGTFFPNGPSIICYPGPDAQTAGMQVMAVVSEHCVPAH